MPETSLTIKLSAKIRVHNAIQIKRTDTAFAAVDISRKSEDSGGSRKIIAFVF